MFDYLFAIDLNRKTLLRMLTGLFAMIGDGVRVRRRVHSAILRDLLAVEASARRLIAVAAVGLGVTSCAKRSAPTGPIPKGSGERMPVFQLFDPRWYAGPPRTACDTAGGARVRFLDEGETRYPDRDVVSPEDFVTAIRLYRRLRAVRHALKTIPAQAKLGSWRRLGLIETSGICETRSAERSSPQHFR